MIVAIYPFFSFVNGFVTSRLYRLWNGTNWLVCGLVASTALPYFLIVSLLVIDLCEYYETSTVSFLPVSDLFLVFAFWLAFNVPITLAGAVYGFS